MLNKVLKWIVVLLFLLTIGRILYLYYAKHDEYYMAYLDKTNTLVYGFDAPRGRILDCNGNILVDNIGINTIVYRKLSNNELEIAKEIAAILPIDTQISEEKIKEFYLETHDTDDLLTEEELEAYKNRKLTEEEVKSLKMKKITEEITNYTEEDMNLIKVYYKMAEGYSYDNKIIKEDVSNEECASIAEAKIKGVTCEVSWKRHYLYDTLNSIYGTIGSIPNEELEEYLNQGYDRDDKVGVSYLEKEYESYLKGTKAVYKVNNDNTLTLLKEGKRGNDIYLSIDIELQQEVDKIVKENMIKAKTMKNTAYYTNSYAIISNPNTGAIVASTGLSYINDTFYDVTTDISNASFIVGSVIKGASMAVGYQNNLIEQGKKINDSCVKLYLVPEKCSYKKLGMIDDITALRTSSNYYQFLLAIKLTGNTYKPNMKLNVTEEHFTTYRNMFANFGLGSSTGIDLPNEVTGIKGTTIADDLLLNFAIGQYDTYTPLQLVQYINTIALDGKRIKLSFMDKILSDDSSILLENQKEVLSTIDGVAFERIKEGFRQVLDGGTGSGYADAKYNAAGKTGTAQVVYDKDTNTVNQTYAMFGPVDNPKYSIVVVSPNTSEINDRVDYIAPINRNIARDLAKLVFEK